ncbi:glycosyltransferase [Ralstonia sp. ASV6]|uniref:glycosyltransferase n=1 Tax=Ralstonia sp. ASV6 TaxID=2795124 RepID=UPI0018ECEE59|nr:glycosyltransferase [Ralstonia sp. ASV6]
MSSQKDLVYVITGLNRAGAELVCLDQASYFARAGYRIGVIYLVKGDDQLVPNFEAIGAETVCLGMRSSLALPLALLRCRSVLRKWRPRVVHSHMIHATILLSLIKWSLPGIKLVATAHNINEGGGMLNLLQRFTRRAPDLATNVSEEATMAYVSRGLFRASSTKCIPNGIDVEKFGFQETTRARPDETFIFICVAQFRPQKNHRALLQAFAKVRSVKQKARLQLLGDGPLLDECKVLARTLGIADAVEFAGGGADVVAALRDADAFVLVSNYEGFGLAAAEAMSVGLPVIGADVAGLREVIGPHGMLPPPDDIDAIAKAMQRCIDAPGTSADRRARREYIVRHFSLNAVLTRWDAEYRRLGL